MLVEPDSLPSATLRVRIADDVMVRGAGRRLAGGTPFRMVQLTDAGAAHMRRWCRSDGDAIGAEIGARALARRLLDHGLLLTCPDEAVSFAGMDARADLDVVVPAHDRAEQLDRCLAALALGGANVMVIDDGSDDASAIADIARDNRATLVRLNASHGPAAARNAGLRATSRPFVAFVDSDVTVPQGSMQRLLAHFADPLVAIAAPRVLPAEPDQSGWVAGYENGHSVLDLGPVPGNVGPGRRVPYVITAAMIARRTAIGSGFVEVLKSGEDVDLGWRAAAAGWRVVYDPGAIVRHDHRVRLMPLLRKRWTYGRSIGPLSQRHPGSVAPLRASGFTVGALAVAATGRPATAAALLAGRCVRLRRQVHGDSRLTATVTGRDIWFTTIGAGRALRRTWSPALLVAAVRSPHARRLLALALMLRLVEDDHLHPRHLPLAALDDLIAALALWSSCAELRLVDPLLPRFHP